MGQLQNDAGSRERGDQLERDHNRGGGLGSARGSGGGANRSREVSLHQITKRSG
jgi:hypothetical protein